MQPGTAKPTKPKTRPITVLIVDDEEKIRRFARILLESDAELDVIGEADNGRAAAALAERLCPDVILMDISMPVMNGLEAARKIVRDCPHTRIILTTAMGADSYRRVSLDAGAAAFLDKASLDSELIKTVHQTAEQLPH